MAEKTVTIPEKEYKQLQIDNEQNKAVIDELIAKVDGLTTAQLQGVGVDPQAAARGNVPYSLVQFTRNHNVAATPSKIQKGTNTHDAYSAECGDVVYLKDDEIARLNGDFEGLLITKEADFKEKMRYRHEWGVDEAGKRAIKRVKDPQAVKVLKEIAVHSG